MNAMISATAVGRGMNGTFLQHPAWYAVRSASVLVVALGLTTGVLVALSSFVDSGA